MKIVWNKGLIKFWYFIIDLSELLSLNMNVNGMNERFLERIIFKYVMIIFKVYINYLFVYYWKCL